MVGTANFQGSQPASAAHGEHSGFEISFLWRRLNLELQMVPQKCLPSLVLTETTQMSVFASLRGTCVPAAWASLPEFFPVTGVDRGFWLCEHRAELGLEKRSLLCCAGAAREARGAQRERLAAWPAEATLCFREGYFASRLSRFFISS